MFGGHMDQYLVLYNPFSGKGTGFENAKKIETHFPDASFSYEDITRIKDPGAFIKALQKDVKPVLIGGDGTLSRTMNQLYGTDLGRDLLYYGGGSGNDFLRDIGRRPKDPPFAINEYMKHLPLVKVNGVSMRFINGVGLGLDGFCCEEVNRAHKEGRELSYGTVALQGLFSKYKPVDAVITIDGERQEYTQVWMAAVMYGSYFGGGFWMAPHQHRDDPAHMVTGIVVHDISRLTGLFQLLKVKAGGGERLVKYVSYRTGSHIEAEFSAPCAFQIDGESISGVTRYEVFA